MNSVLQQIYQSFNYIYFVLEILTTKKPFNFLKGFNNFMKELEVPQIVFPSKNIHFYSVRF